LLVVGKPINFDIELIKQRIRANNLDNDVLFKAEYIPFAQMGAYFFSADILVFPYKEIDMSGSLQLACAFGKPVVCADSGGLPEVVSQDKNGILVPANDSSALSEGLVRLLADDGLRQQMGEESLRMAKEDFSWASIASATIKVYQELLRG
jgi:glycosyltransferase involved in cell wall biosynthesis